VCWGGEATAPCDTIFKEIPVIPQQNLLKKKKNQEKSELAGLECGMF